MKTRPITRYVLFATAGLVGGGGLLLFGLFLLTGPIGIVNLSVDAPQLLLIDGGLCLLFFVQHSVMIRRSFRNRAGKHIPARSLGAVYAIVSGFVLLILVVLWQESPHTVFELTGIGLLAVRLAVLLAFLFSVWSIRSLKDFDVFGLRPPTTNPDAGRRRVPELVVSGTYRWVRHPLYFVVLVVLWCYPALTTDRLLLNTTFTVWIVLGAILEERDLAGSFGQAYRDYQKSVPMLLPWKIPRK